MKAEEAQDVQLPQARLNRTFEALKDAGVVAAASAGARLNRTLEALKDECNTPAHRHAPKRLNRTFEASKDRHLALRAPCQKRLNRTVRCRKPGFRTVYLGGYSELNRTLGVLKAAGSAPRDL